MNPRFETINGKLCRIVEQPCPRCGQSEIIAEPVKEGSKEWAVWQMMQGKQIVLGNGSVKHYHIRFIKENAVFCSACGQLTLDINDWLLSAEKSGWQLYEPKQEPPKEPDYIICKRCGGSQSVPNPAVSNTAYTTCPKCGGTGYEIKEQKKEPEKESPIDPIERPLRSLILRAKEEGKNIRTYCQDMVFTPVALTGLLANGRFRWWNICNWELTDREQNYYPQISYDETEPEPFAKVKVGDWVTDGVVVGLVAVINDGKAWVKTQDAQYHLSVEHLRKLDPSEVVIQIGCLRGVVRPLSTNSIHLWFHLVNNKDEVSATIRLTDLDPQTRQLVEKLLKAQEEE